MNSSGQKESLESQLDKKEESLSTLEKENEEVYTECMVGMHLSLYASFGT